MAGRTLSHYNILEKIGAGAMGEVYLAEDTKLSRNVALKVLTAELAQNNAFRARFKREAKAAAALNHPGIVHVYSVEEADGIHFITLELVRGKMLSELIAKRGQPLGQFLEIAIPVADAMSEAHQAGVVHRDLKPNNVMVTEDGRPKILDFGLVKIPPQFAGSAASTLPTEFATSQGIILGTPPYMSPEQAEGKPLDPRSDIFSIGVVFYEMATGERPFKGDSPASILSAILRDTPAPATEVNPRIPKLLGRIIGRCLEKDREHRFQTAKDLRDALEELKQELDSGKIGDTLGSALAGRNTNKALAIVAALSALLAVSIGLQILSRSVPNLVDSTPPKHRQISFTGEASLPAVSPDGAFAAYVTGHAGVSQKVMVHDLAGEQALEVFEGSTIFSLRWSPDGARLLFGSGTPEPGTFIVPRLGGPARHLPFYPYTSWSPDGTRFAGCYANSKSIALTDVSTEDATSIALSGSFSFMGLVDWAPRGDRLAFVTIDGEGQYAIWTAATDGSRQFKVVEEGRELPPPPVLPPQKTAESARAR